MNKKNKIVWIDGIPCIDIDLWPGRPPRLGPGRHPILGLPNKLIQPGIHEMWEFTIHFLQPKDFTSMQQNKEKNYLEQILKDLEKLFKEGDF